MNYGEINKTERYELATTRRKRAWELRLAGKTMRVISEELGISFQHVAKILDDERKKLNAATAEIADDVRRMESERLDVMQSALWENARKGNSRAVSLTLQIMERRAKLLGLDMPVRIAQTKSNGEDIENELTLAATEFYSRLDEIIVSSTSHGDNIIDDNTRGGGSEV